MGIEMEYTGGDGRKYNSLEELIAAEGDRALSKMVVDVERAAEAERCPVHGKRATVSVKHSGGQVGYTIDGCCDELVERAQRAAEVAAR